MRSRFWKINMVLFFSLTLCGFVYAADELRESKVLAEVNGEAITQGDLDIAIEKQLPRAFYHKEVSQEKIKEIEKTAFEDIINEMLFSQEAKAQGIKAEKSEVKARFEKIEKQYPSKKEFKEALKKYKVSKGDIEDRLKKDLLIEKLIEKETKTVLTDKELEDYYNKNTEKFREPEAVGIRDIFIKYNMSEVDFRKKAEERAKDVMAKLKAGKDFAEMASIHSDDISKAKGGDVGFIHKDSFAPEIEGIAFSLKIGQMSSPIATEYGYHIIKVEGKKPSRQILLAETKEKLRGELTSSYQAKKKEELIKRLRHNAKITYY